MLRQIRFELYKMYRKPRTYLGYGCCLFINICVMLGLRYGHMEQISTDAMHGSSFGLVGSPVNAEFMAWMVTGSTIGSMIMLMGLPFYVCIVSGEIFAGEVAEGTLRTVLVRPVNRASFFTAKFISTVLYAATLPLFLCVTAFLIGLVFFGHGGLMATGTLEHPVLAWYPESAALWRLGLSCLLIWAGATTVGMVALLISGWLNNSLGALGAATMVLFAMSVIGAIPWFKPISPYLFSTHLYIGQKAFLDPIPWAEIWSGLRCLGVYSLGLFLVALAIFRRKDVLA